jgi:hypothetical protein
MFGYKHRKDLQFLCQAVESPAPGVQLPAVCKRPGNAFILLPRVSPSIQPEEISPWRESICRTLLSPSRATPGMSASSSHASRATGETGGGLRYRPFIRMVARGRTRDMAKCSSRTYTSDVSCWICPLHRQQRLSVLKKCSAPNPILFVRGSSYRCIRILQNASQVVHCSVQGSR